MDLKPEGYAVDKKYPDIIYVPEDAQFDLHKQTSFLARRQDRARHQVAARKRPTSGLPATRSAWKSPARTAPGGSSARSPKARFATNPAPFPAAANRKFPNPSPTPILTGPVFVADFKKDFDQVAELIERDYSGRFKDPTRTDPRTILSAERSLGSVIKLLTPDERDYKPGIQRLAGERPAIPQGTRLRREALLQAGVGRALARPFQRGHHQRQAGNELKCDNRKLVTTYLRVGFDTDGSWRTFGLRKDFHPAVKIQIEDDITASVVVPPGALERLARRATATRR